LISTIPWWVTKLSTNNITYLLQGNWSCWRTALPLQVEIVDAAVVFKTTFWQLLLWRWIKPLNFCDKDQGGLLRIQATFWFFCVGDM
jgi:hypothetical protein